MNIAKAHLASSTLLKKVGIENPKLEAEVIIRYVLSITRTQFYMSLMRELLLNQKKQIEALIKERANFKPLAYITNHKEFYGLNIIVNPSVLIPRPETEILIDIAIKYSKNKNNLLRIADLGTGSGAIAIAIAKNILNSKIEAIDISKNSIEIAKLNSRKHFVSKKINFLYQNIFEPTNHLFELIISNPPYLKTKTLPILQREIQKEPKIALDGGEDGFKFIKYIIQKYYDRLSPNGCIIIEIDPHQKNQIIDLSKNLNLFDIKFYKDLNNLTRAVKIIKN